MPPADPLPRGRRRCARCRLGSEGNRLLANVVVTILQTAGGHDVHRHTEQVLERILEVHQVEQGRAGLELDQEIDVARARVIAAGNRPEPADPPSEMPPDALSESLPLLVDRTSPLSQSDQ